MSLACELVAQVQQIVAQSPRIFDALYNTCDYIFGDDRCCHQRTTGLLIHAAWMLPGRFAVEPENRFVVGYAPHPTKPGKQKTLTWHPDVALRDTDIRVGLFVDFESPNSSDARVISRNINEWYFPWMEHHAQAAEYLIITSLPDNPAPDWIVMYDCNREHRKYQEQIRSNPFRYWYRHYRQHYDESWKLLPVSFANFNGSKLELVDFDRV